MERSKKESQKYWILICGILNVVFYLHAIFSCVTCTLICISAKELWKDYYTGEIEMRKSFKKIC